MPDRFTTLTREWGSTADERALDFPCDHYVKADDALFRAVTVDAPASVIFRWLCQLRVAPYSYDWIDNWGRRSPRELTPGVDDLETGQRVMTIFRLVEFEIPRQLTIVMERGTFFFGKVAVTYRVDPVTEQRSRLFAKLAVTWPRGVTGAVTRRWLPAGDLVMMRKQLLTLKSLAERDARVGIGGAGTPI